MKACVYGTGAIGGYLAARLIAARQSQVSVVARGAQLEAIRARGLRLETPDGTIDARPAAATENPLELAAQDVVFVTLKAKDLPAAASAIVRLLKPGGHAVFVTNGLPWWWNYRGRSGALSLPLLDPAGELWQQLGPARALGCVVYSMNTVTAPGVVRHTANNRWILGEPDNSASPRLAATAALLRDAGMQAETSSDLRLEIWIKLLKNAPINPVCALTRLDTDQLAQRPDLCELVGAIGAEVAAVATAMGWDVARFAGAAKQALAAGGAVPGAPRAKGVKPSMLQDVLAQRPTEVDAILGQLQCFAREAGVSSPAIDVALALLRGLDAGLRAVAAPVPRALPA